VTMEQAAYNTEHSRRIAIMVVNELHKLTLTSENRDIVILSIINTIPKLAKLSMDDFIQWSKPPRPDIETNIR
jgi:hypothetical protein